MQKIFILVILVIFSLSAKSQDDSTDYTLSNIKKYAAHIESSLPKISSNLQGDKQQAVVQQAENIKVYIDSIEEEMQYLPDEYYYHLSSLISSFHTDVEEFEKLILNEDFQSKDQFLSKALTSLQLRQTEFQKALFVAYNAVSQGHSLLENKWNKEIISKDAPQLVEEDSVKNTAGANSSNVVLVEAVNPTEITTSNNAILLDTIHGAQQQIEQWISGIHLAIAKNNFSRAGVFAKNITSTSLKIGDLSLLLKTEQKQSLYILSTGLKNLAETLYALTLKGIASKKEMEECAGKIAIKFSTLSTGINLVQ